MISPINTYFDHVYYINLESRPDKRLLCEDQFSKHGIIAERFIGHDTCLDDKVYGRGNVGCTASHRGVLELICHNRFKRTLILEDDFLIRSVRFNTMFETMSPFVPLDWDMLYLGGHYGEAPTGRINDFVIHHRHMLTTSSYGVTLEQARRMVIHISGVGPIDSLYYQFHENNKCYIFQPRLMVQRPCFSDIQQRECDNQQCMEDISHESMV